MSVIHAQVTVLVDGMQEAIRDFEDGRLSIDRLAWQLKSRIAALRQVSDEAWVDELKAIWNQLELINALFIESKREVLSSGEQNDAAEVLNELRAALATF
jgi:hypothetical protein